MLKYFSLKNSHFFPKFRDNGDATECCATNPDGVLSVPPIPGSNNMYELICGANAGVCMHFYDSAPAGAYGSLTYLARGALEGLGIMPDNGYIDCMPT